LATVGNDDSVKGQEQDFERQVLELNLQFKHKHKQQNTQPVSVSGLGTGPVFTQQNFTNKNKINLEPGLTICGQAPSCSLLTDRRHLLNDRFAT
jgi:hypothetical protein